MREKESQEHNTSHPQITREVMDSVVNKIVAAFQPDAVVIFGSSAKTQTELARDLDLLVVMPSDLPRHKRAVPLRLLFNPAPCPMDILVYTPSEIARWRGVANHIVTEAFAHGRIAYERT